MKEKKKERKERERERESGSYFIIKSTVPHGVHVVKTGAEKFTASTRAESTREKEHIGEDPVSKAPPGTENGPPPDRPKSDLFCARTDR